jgi:hypothetical protein
MALRIEGHIELRQAFHSTVTTAQCQVANLSLVIEERISRKRQEAGDAYLLANRRTTIPKNDLSFVQHHDRVPQRLISANFAVTQATGCVSKKPITHHQTHRVHFEYKCRVPLVSDHELPA